MKPNLPVVKQNSIQTISLLGCGWFGTPLAKELVRLGYLIKGSTTSPSKLNDLGLLGIQPYLIEIQESAPIELPVAHRDFFNCDLLLINIPPGRNTSAQHSFFQKVEQIAHIATMLSIREVMFISSTSVYGDHNKEVDESSFPLPDTVSGKMLLDAEKFLVKHGFRTTIIRFGGLIGPQRNPGRFLAGKTGISNGDAPVNLIHLYDCIGITLRIIEKLAFGKTYNAVAPSHPSRQIFYTLAARRSKLTQPQFIAEIKQWKKVNSIYLQSLLDYTFKLPHWEDWI